MESILTLCAATDPTERGPVICSRFPSSIKHRNALGAHSGSYSIYRALLIAMGALEPTHKPDYSLTSPPINIPPNPTNKDCFLRSMGTCGPRSLQA